MENQAGFIEKFNEYLDRKHGLQSVLIYEGDNTIYYPTSKILKRVDPVRYGELFDEWFINTKRQIK